MHQHDNNTIPCWRVPSHARLYSYYFYSPSLFPVRFPHIRGRNTVSHVTTCFSTTPELPSSFQGLQSQRCLNDSCDYGVSILPVIGLFSVFFRIYTNVYYGYSCTNSTLYATSRSRLLKDSVAFYWSCPQLLSVAFAGYSTRQQTTYIITACPSFHPHVSRNLLSPRAS